MPFCYFICLGRYCFRPTAALPAQAAADGHLAEKNIPNLDLCNFDYKDKFSQISKKYKVKKQVWKCPDFAK